MLIELVTSSSELQCTCTHRLVKLDVCSTAAVAVQDVFDRVKLKLKAEALGQSVDELIEEAAKNAKHEIWECIEGLWLRQDVEETKVWEVKERVRGPPRAAVDKVLQWLQDSGTASVSDKGVIEKPQR